MEVTEALKQHPRLAAVGPAGRGKTALLYHLMLNRVEACGRNENEPVPVYLRCQDWPREGGALRDLVVRQALAWDDLRPGEYKALVSWLPNQRWVLLLDTLDEVRGHPKFPTAAERRGDLLHALHDFLETGPGVSQAILTSREGAFAEQEELLHRAGFHRMELKPFTREQAEGYALLYHGEEAGRAFCEALDERAWRLGEEPLYLRLMCWLYRLGRLRIPAAEDELWEQVVQALFAQRNIRDEMEQWQLQGLLEHLAFHSLFCRQGDLQANWVRRETLRFAQVRGFTAETGLRWLDHCRHCELLAQDGESYTLTPLPLHEYFAACYLAHQIEVPPSAIRDPRSAIRDWAFSDGDLPCPFCGVQLPPFRDYFWAPEWRETLLLFAGVLKDAEPLLERLERERDDKEPALLILRAARWLDSWFSSFLFDDKEPALLILRAQALARTRRELPQRAKRCLGQLWKRWQWADLRQRDRLSLTWASLSRSRVKAQAERVVDQCCQALQNRNWRVRCAAALALGEMEEAARAAVPDLVRVALGDEDGWVRRAAAAALGKMGEAARAAVSDLGTALHDEDGPVRVAVAWALWRMGEA
jgi:HEAT repeat protein